MHNGNRAILVQTITGMVLITAVFPSTSAAATFQDSAAGYSITLPAGWKDSLLSSTSRIFRDSTNGYHAIVGVVRYDYNSALYKSEKEWCLSMSAAYEISVKSNPFFGFIYVCDSTLQDGHFAMYANAEYGMPIRSEAIRWTARSRYGYELYVYTDTLDMYLHFAQYKSFLDSVNIFPPAGVVSMSAKNHVSIPRRGVILIPLHGNPPKIIPGFQGRLVIVNSIGRHISSVTYRDGRVTGVPTFKETNKNTAYMVFGIMQAHDE